MSLLDPLRSRRAGVRRPFLSAPTTAPETRNVSPLLCLGSPGRTTTTLQASNGGFQAPPGRRWCEAGAEIRAKGRHVYASAGMRARLLAVTIWYEWGMVPLRLLLSVLLLLGYWGINSIWMLKVNR